MIDWKSMKDRMADAGCSETVIQRAERLFRYGSSEDLIRCLRSCRCDALEAIHEKQKRLDRLDMLIRETKRDKGENT